MARLSLSMLGTFRVTLEGRPVNFQYNKAKALLAYLAVESGEPQSREGLAALLWPNLPDTAARRNLTQALSNLRKILANHRTTASFLSVSRETIHFNSDSDHEFDLTALSALLAACHTHAHRRIESCSACAARLRQAAGLYRGDFLAYFSVGDSGSFDEWVESKRAALREQALWALAHLAAYHERQGEFEQAAALARRQLELDPWREAAHRQLMRLLAASGQRNAALAHYDSVRLALARELDTPPEPETTALYDHLRLDLPGALAATGSPTRTHNFPALADPFVGRRRELHQLADLIEQRACRLLTLTGPGGIGKTRLAVRAAEEQAAAFADGVYFVPLSSLNSAEFLVSAIAGAVGITFQSAHDPHGQLLRFLREQELLLVLDSAEDLLAAPASADLFVGLLSDILSGAPEVSLFVTSREPLGLKQEWLFAVPGLEVPPQAITGRVADYDAVQFFEQCARRVDHSYNLSTDRQAQAIRICRMLAGMPLGIEMAARWVSVMTEAEIAEEIQRNLDFLQAPPREVSGRHGSLRAVFDQSWQLLTETERHTFSRLSVFRGGFDREAAEQVAGGTLLSLATLVDKAWLQRNATGRYDMHALLRQYGGEQLSSSTDAVRQRHAAYYLALAETGAPAHYGESRQLAWLDQMATEQDNLRAALAWSVVAGDGALAGLRLVSVLYWSWSTRGAVKECRDWLERALAHPEAENYPQARAIVLLHLGLTHWVHGDHAAAEACMASSLQLVQAQGDRRASAEALGRLGVVALYRGDTTAARLRLEGSVALYRELGDTLGLAGSLGSLGGVAVMLEDIAWATALLEEALTKQRELGNFEWFGWALNQLGHVAQLRGEYDRARQLHEECLEQFRKINPRFFGIVEADQSLGETALAQGQAALAKMHFSQALTLARDQEYRNYLAWCLAGLAGVAALEEEPQSAARLWGTAEALRQSMGTRPAPASRATRERLTTAVKEQLGEDAFAAAWVEGQSMTLDQAIDLALDEPKHVVAPMRAVDNIPRLDGRS